MLELAWWHFSAKLPPGQKLGENGLLIGSAGFNNGDYKGLQVDYVVLGIGGLGLKSVAYQDAFFQNCVLDTGAEVVFISHWDRFTSPLVRPLKPLFGSKMVVNRFQLASSKSGTPVVRLLIPWEDINILH